MTEINLLGRKDILNADDFDTDIVMVPEWENETGANAVRIRSTTAKEADDIGFDMLDRDGGVNPLKAKGMRTRLVLMCTIDEKGLPLFEDRDLDKLARKSSKPIERISDKIRELSGMTDILEVTVTCSECGNEEHFLLDDLEDMAKKQAQPEKND
jgi:hypothetical protein